jgi:predicted ABC-type ATPase
MDKRMYIIAGCNGAGKTTASYTILPDIIHCKEFVNADSIAAGLSPFAPENATIEAGRIMLHRINELMNNGADFAFETTLSTRFYVQMIKEAQAKGYFVTLLFLWLDRVSLAKERVQIRVSEGGHNIPEEVIERRYYRGIKNLFELYIPICNSVILFDNSHEISNFVMMQDNDGKAVVYNEHLLQQIKNCIHGKD